MIYIQGKKNWIDTSKFKFIRCKAMKNRLYTLYSSSLSRVLKMIRYQRFLMTYSSLIFVSETFFAKSLSRPLKQRYLMTYSPLIFVSVTESQLVSQYFEIFQCFTKLSLHHNWNVIHLLLINIVCMSCLASCQMTWDLGS